MPHPINKLLGQKNITLKQAMIQAQTTQLINTNKLKQFIGFPVVTFATRWTYGP